MRLIVVADHSLIAHAIRLALRHTACFEIIGSVDGRYPVAEALKKHAPDVVLVDDMQDPDLAIARLREIAEHVPLAQRLMLVAGMDEDRLGEVFDAGAQTVLSKTVDPVALGTLLREVVRGNVMHRFERRPSRGATQCSLTQREREILGLAAEGNTNGQIARTLWVTEQTVKFHLSNTYRKLGVANRTEASRYAMVNGLVPPVHAMAS